MVVSSGDAGNHTRMRPASEREEVGVQSIGVRQEESVRGVFVDPQRAPLQQSSSLVPAELERRLNIAVTVNDQCRNVEGSQRVTEIAGEPGQEELNRCSR
jgi:hypothetical protein